MLPMMRELKDWFCSATDGKDILVTLMLPMMRELKAVRYIFQHLFGLLVTLMLPMMRELKDSKPSSSTTSGWCYTNAPHDEGTERNLLLAVHYHQMPGYTNAPHDEGTESLIFLFKKHTVFILLH